MIYWKFILIIHRKQDLISCKLTIMETICIKSQILFSGKNKKTIINVSFAEFAKRVVKVNGSKICQVYSVALIIREENTSMPDLFPLKVFIPLKVYDKM